MRKTGFEPIYDEDSNILILGSFPSVISRENGFYYTNRNNRFWKIMGNIYKETTDTTFDKILLLKKNHIALWDVVLSCEIEGSSDTDIKDPVIADIDGLIKKTKIKKIYVNGRKAQKLYDEYQRNVTNIEAIYLPSSSPANAAFSLDRLTEIYKKALTQDSME